jgi:hypothetical protein
LDDATLHGDSNGSDLVVSRDHPDSDTSVVAVHHGFGHFLSDDILDSDDGDQSVTSLFDFVDLGAISLVLVSGTTISIFDVLIGQTDGSESLLGEMGDLLFQFLFLAVVQFLSLAISVQVVSAGAQDDLRSTLDLQCLAVTVLYKGRHSLTGRVELESKKVRELLSVRFDVTLATSDELEHGEVCSLNTIFAWNPFGVAGHSLLQFLKSKITFAEVTCVEVILTVRIGDFVLISLPHVGQSHLVLCQSSSFVRADVVGTSHNLTRGELLDEVLILEHLLD